MSPWVVFELDGRAMACPVGAVREVVRLGEPAVLPGTDTGVVGVMDVRGRPLPVLDVRATNVRAATDDVLVTPLDGGWVGLVVDRVRAVLPYEELRRPAGSAGRPGQLPDWVVDVVQAVAEPGQVFSVDLVEMVRALRGALVRA